LQAAGFGLYKVLLPPQEIEGSVHLKVVPRPLASVSLMPPDSADLAAVRRALPPLCEGSTPNLRKLARAMELANENVARQVAVTFAEAATLGAIDAKVEIQARKPWSASLRLDNSGNNLPAHSRLTASLSHANLFGLDHSLTGTYITSPEAWSDVEQYGGFYKAPIYPLAGSLTGYWFHSSVNSGNVANLFNISGSGRFAGISYTQHLLAIGDWRPTLQIGWDDKIFEDNSAFSGSRFGSDVRSRPLTLGVAARVNGVQGRGGVSISYARNIGGGGHNSDADYAAVRAGAKQDWDVWRANADATWQFQNGFALAMRSSGQWATEALIGGEQFGFGGQDSLRALETRQVLGDSGYQGSLELWLPPFKGVSFLGFFDGGWISRKNAVAGAASTDDAIDIGVGLRWQYAPYVALSLDYGYLLNGAGGAASGNDRVYASITFQY
jgi:hemolysin activation/secretion protein